MAWAVRPNPIRSSRCSNLIEECFSEVLLLCDQYNSLHEMSLPRHAGDPQVPSDVSNSHGTEAGAWQAIEVTTNFGEALGTASPLGWRSQCGRSRAAGPIHLHGAITSAHPIPVASGNCPERLGRASRRGPSR